MRFYSNGINYHLRIHQNQPSLPLLLMLHGFMGSPDSFNDLIKPLSEFCNPVTIDLLGHGKTGAPADPNRFTTKQQVDDLVSVISRLQTDELFIYGYSMGGRLAIQIAVNFPDTLKGLILESTHCGIKDPQLRKSRTKTDEERARKIETEFEKFLEDWAKLPLFTPPGSDPYMEYVKQMKDQNPALMAASLRGFGAGQIPYACDRFTELQLPAGLIAGEYDQKYVEKMGEMAHLCKNADFKIIEGAAHRVHADQPESIVQFLNHFITKHYG